ncbi:MAG: hypothetical protein HDR72_06320 [Ruminococcaceae bacterium]|nr:hypothetical protein [Oscillospiraceae bacterium]
MNEFFGTLSSHVKRGILSPVFFICTALTVAMMIFYVRGSYSVVYASGQVSGLHYFLHLVDLNGTRYLMLMISSFPAVTLFYEDWTCGAVKFLIPRAGRRKYSFAVMIASGLTAAALIIISYMIFSGFVLLKHPIVTNYKTAEDLRYNTIGFPNSGLLYTGREFLCYLLYFLTRGAMGAFFAVAAVLQSMIITNKHLTAISPVMLYILYFSLNFYCIIPELLNPFVLFWNGFRLYIIFGGTAEGSLFSPLAAFYPLVFCIAIIMIFSLAGSIILRIKMNRSI